MNLNLNLKAQMKSVLQNAVTKHPSEVPCNLPAITAHSEAPFTVLFVFFLLLY